jgi:hypothetical protein
MSEELARGPENFLDDWFAHAIAHVATYPESYRRNRLTELTIGYDIATTRGPDSAELMAYLNTVPDSGLITPSQRDRPQLDSITEAKRVRARHIAATAPEAHASVTLLSFARAHRSVDR